MANTLYQPDIQNATNVVYGDTYSTTLNGVFSGETYIYTITGNDILTVNYTKTNYDKFIITLYDYNLNELSKAEPFDLSGSTSFILPIAGSYVITIAGIVGTNTTVSFDMETKFYVPNIVLLPEPLKMGIEFDVNLTIKRKVKSCDVPIIYEHISGELPPNLKFRPDGFIYGKIVEMDCFTDNSVKPSITFTDNNEIPTSTEYIYPIKVNAYFVGDRSSGVEKDLDICIRNNWSLTRDDFLSMDNIEYVEQIYPPFEPFEQPSIAKQLCEITPNPNDNLKKIDIDELCKEFEVIDLFNSPSIESLCVNNNDNTQQLKIVTVDSLCQKDETSDLRVIPVDELCGNKKDLNVNAEKTLIPKSKLKEIHHELSLKKCNHVDIDVIENKFFKDTYANSVDIIT